MVSPRRNQSSSWMMELEVQLLGGEQREAWREIEARLRAEDRIGAGAGAVGFEPAVVEDEVEKIEVGAHRWRDRYECSSAWAQRFVAACVTKCKEPVPTNQDRLKCKRAFLVLPAAKTEKGRDSPKERYRDTGLRNYRNTQILICDTVRNCGRTLNAVA